MLESLRRKKVASLPRSPSVDPYHKRSEVSPLLEAGLRILTLLFLFVSCKNFIRIFVTLQLGIGVRHTNINDAVRCSGPKASNKDISAVVV